MLISSVFVLFLGAEFSLDASEKLGKKLGLSPLVIGMLLIGFGTSLPEFFVAHIAGAQGKSDIAVGSLIGSNIANMFLVLGISGLIAKISLSNFAVRKQTVVHIILVLVLAFCLAQPVLTVVAASPLIILCGIYLYILYKEMKSSPVESKSEEEFSPGKVFLKLIAGFGFLYLGGELLVKSGTEICAEIGISEYVISAIFIAFGTSFPELVTSVLAALKKKDSDLIVGNIIGSNLFNCAFILGSLGIYDFSFSKDFSFELIALFLGSLVLVFLSYRKIILFRKVSLLFVSSYFVIVAHWLKVF
jgi:cation:H+ antiporter